MITATGTYINVYTEDSKYIGEGAFFCVERKKGMHERGYVPYC